MEEWFNKICKKFYVKFTDFLNHGGGYVLFIWAVLAIILAIVGFYMVNGFNWKWFAFFHLPIYIFCGWALYKALQIYNKTINR